ncbi:unnamed protein product [Urochloa humidicola]
MSSSQAVDEERDKAGNARYARSSGSSSGRCPTSRSGDGSMPPATSSSQTADKEGDMADGTPCARSSDSSWSCGRFRTSPHDADSVRGLPPMSSAAGKADPYARPSDSSSGRSRPIPLNYGVKRTGSLLQPTPPQQELDVAGACGGDTLLLAKVQDCPADARAVGDPRLVEGAGILHAGAAAQGDPQLGDDDGGVLDMDMDDDGGVLDMHLGDDGGVLDMDMDDDAGILYPLGLADGVSGEPIIRMMCEVLALGNLDGLLHDPHSRQQIETVLHQIHAQGNLASNLQAQCKLGVSGVDQVPEDVQDHTSNAHAEVNPALQLGARDMFLLNAVRKNKALDLLGTDDRRKMRATMDEGKDLLNAVNSKIAQGLLPIEDVHRIRTTLDRALNQGLLPAQRKHGLDPVSTAGIDLKPEDVQICPVGRGTKANPQRKKIHSRPVKRGMPQVSSIYNKIDKMKDNLEVDNLRNCRADIKVDPQCCKVDSQHHHVKPAMPHMSSINRQIIKMASLDPEDVQAGTNPEADSKLKNIHHRPVKPAITQVSPIYVKTDKMKDQQHVYLNYTFGIQNVDLTCMVMAVLVFNILLPFLPLSQLSVDDPISLVWTMSLMICTQIFLLILPVRTTTGVMDALCRTFFGPLLGFAASKLVSPFTGMAVAYLSTAWVGGLFGYSFSQYLQHIGMEEEANMAVTFHLSLSKEKRRQRVYTQVETVFCSSTMIIFMAVLILWLVSSATEDVYFSVWVLSVLVWWMVCFILLVLSSLMLDRPCVTERTMAYYIASFPASIPLALISQLLWVYFFGLEMILISAFLGYKLAIYANYRGLVPRGGEDTVSSEDGNEDAATPYTSAETNTSSDSSSTSPSDSSQSGDDEITATPVPAHEEINTSSYSSCSSESGAEETTASFAAAHAPANEEMLPSEIASMKRVCPVETPNYKELQ